MWRDRQRECDHLAVEEIREQPDGPALRFVHVDEVPAQEVVAQLHGARRVGVHLKFLEWTKDRMVAFTYYDPGLILERHAQAATRPSSSSRATSPSAITLPRRHPHRAGEGGRVRPDSSRGRTGARFLECYGDDVRPVPVDKDAYFDLLAEQGISRLPNPVWEAPPGAPVVERGEADTWS